MNMKRLVAMAVAAGAAVAAVAMPTKQELQKAQEMVSDVTASDLKKLRAKTKTFGEVAVRYMQLASQSGNEAEKYLLLQGAFKLYAKSGDYEGAANALVTMNREIADMNPEVIVEIYNKAIFSSMKEKAPKLYAVKEAARRQVFYRKQLAKSEAAVKANPKDPAAQKQLGECYAELGDWPKALNAFALAGGALAKTAKSELDGSAAPQVFGDFWWDYMSGDEISTYKLHAAGLYRAALACVSSFKGLARARAEQRVKEAEVVDETHGVSDVYVPGLQQGVFRNGGCADVNFYATCAEADCFSHTLGTILADVNPTEMCQTRNELTGTIETWPQWGAVLYEGEMYFEGGREYNFFGVVVHLIACQLDGSFLLCEGNIKAGQGVTVVSRTFKESGWRPIRLWLANYGGIRGAGKPDMNGIGFGWNTNGCKVVNTSTKFQWSRLLDDGSGRLLRSKVLPQKSVLQDKCGSVGTKDGEVRTFGAQDGLPCEIEMVWIAAHGEIDGFWINKKRVTQGQWKCVTGYNPVDKDKQDDNAQIGPLDWWDQRIVEFLWALNIRYTGAGRFARLSDAQKQLAAKYCSVGLSGEFDGLRFAFRPSDKRNSEREEQKLVMRGSDVAFKMPNTQQTSTVKGTEGKETVDGYTWSYRVKNGEAEIVAEKDGKFSCAVSPNLTGEVKIPSTLGGVKVTRIGERAFRGLGMTSVLIPASVTSIGVAPFAWCGGLTRIDVAAGNHGFVSVGGVLCTKDLKELVMCPPGLTTVTVPESVTNIREGAFHGCKLLAALTIPSAVKNIKTWAFSGCRGLTSVAIPASVTNIDDGVFWNCSGLTTVTMRGECPTAKNDIFKGCRNLKAIHVPSNCKSWAGMKEWQGIPLVFDRGQ